MSLGFKSKFRTLYPLYEFSFSINPGADNSTKFCSRRGGHYIINEIYRREYEKWFGFDVFAENKNCPGQTILTLQLFVNYFIWLRIIDEGFKREMRIWSILLN